MLNIGTYVTQGCRKVKKFGSASDVHSGSGIPVTYGSDAVSRWAGWALADRGFGVSVNPISNQGDRLCSPHYCLPTRI